jgi:hypothetical protein
MRSIRYDELQHAIDNLSKSVGAIFQSYRIVGAILKWLLLSLFWALTYGLKWGIEEDNIYM